MVEFVNFKAYPHPLGGEIDISYDYSEQPTNDCETYIFKCAQPIDDAVIYNFLDNNEASKDITIWHVQNYLQKTWDYQVETGQSYFYRGIIQRKKVEDDGTITVTRSAIADSKVAEIISEVIIHSIPMKQMVMDGIKKLVKAIVDNLNKANPEIGHLIDLSVYDHFPVISEPTQFFTVTRASSDEGMKYWSNTFYRDSERVIKGDVESETINVTWMVINNPKMRDQMTNIMRGARFWLRKYLMRQFQSGVIEIGITMMADGDENPEDQLHLFYSGMLIHFLVETQLIYKQPSALLENIKVELGFDVAKN